MWRDTQPICVRPDEPLGRAIACIDQGRCGIALVTDRDGRLLGTITDGDIRRALLARQDMDQSIEAFLDAKAKLSPYVIPVTAPVGTDADTLLALMTTQAIRQIPLVDERGRVADVVILDDVLRTPAPLGAVIMAGGMGTRLMPLTENLPKPMLPVGGRPLMEHIIEQLQQAGIRHVNVSTHYMPEKIIEHFGDGQTFGVDLQYVNEDRPLGTAGALGLMTPPNETQLVINGDILTQVDFRAMLEFHHDNAAEMTVAVQYHEMQVPYGVIECDGARVARFKEKPKTTFLVNAGVYLLEPSVYQFIPSGETFNMTDLIRRLLDADRRVISFPLREYWLDIGRHNDYERAQVDVTNGRVNR
jgi:dTDP-glucose pyrophosphorylase